MHLNAQKCTFAVTFGKLAGYMLNPFEIKTVIEIQPLSRSKKGIKRFLGRLSIAKFKLII